MTANVRADGKVRSRDFLGKIAELAPRQSNHGEGRPNQGSHSDTGRMMTLEDQVWNRAALESGGQSPGPGDRALAELLRAHGLVMNGGVHHALEFLNASELLAAADGFAFFGLHDVAALFRDAKSDPVLAKWTGETERVANGRYSTLVPNDGLLVAHFEAVFHERPDQFSPM